MKGRNRIVLGNVYTQVALKKDMMLERVILTVLILLQAVAGGLGAGTGVICLGSDGHVAIERAHRAGHCESSSVGRSCAPDHEHEVSSAPCERDDDCEDVELIDIDLKREAPTASLPVRGLPGHPAPCVVAAASSGRATARAVRITHPPDRVRRDIVRTTVIII